MIKRLFIETDVLQKDELRNAQRILSEVLKRQGLDYPKDVFDETKDFAWHDAEAAWEAVLRADEIYGDSSLVPLLGYGTYTGSPVVMNVMMKKAVDQKVTGKKLIFLRQYKDLDWDMIDLKLLRKAFKKNQLFTTEVNDVGFPYAFVPVDVTKITADE